MNLFLSCNQLIKNSLSLLLLVWLGNKTYAQNSMTGDGFGGRCWYVAHNYQVGAYSAFTVCGDSNQLYGWGRNVYGELGNGTYTSTVSPVKALGMTNTKFYTTGYMSAAIKKDNSAWVWGGSFLAFTNIPQSVLTDVKFVDAGINHVVFVKNDGTVWGVGKNERGELGNGTISSMPIINPTNMSGITDAVRAIAVGESSAAATIILLHNGTVKITGGGEWFQANNSTIPVVLPLLNNIIDIKGNTVAAFALDSSGHVYAFGRDNGDYSGLGLGTPLGEVITPTKIVFPAGAAPIVALSANADGFCAFALDSNHKVYGWGRNTYGELGNNTFNNQSTPKLIATNVIDIFAGENFSYVLKADGTLWATGQSGYSPSSDGSIWMNLPNIQRNIFTQIDPTIQPMNLCAPKAYGVVPIQLLNFTCTTVDNTANLTWISAEETNADKYIVEYSKDGSNFQSIAIVNPKGSNSKYKYVHQQVNGSAFYRLKMMDRDESFRYSEICVLKLNSKSYFTIAPNPANEAISICISTSSTITLVQLISMQGKVMKIIKNYISDQKINIANIPRGGYILEITSQDGKNEFGKFIKL